MRIVTCLIDHDNISVPEKVCQSYETMARRRHLPSRWLRLPHVAILEAGDGEGGGWSSVHNVLGAAVGYMRLDNRGEILDLLGRQACDGDDLSLAFELIVTHGVKYVPRLLGDFAFVVWNAHRHVAIAACDAFGVKSLFYSAHDSVVAFSTRAEALAIDEHYDVQYLAERVAHCLPAPSRTVFKGIQAVAGSHLVVLSPGTLTRHQYWSAYDIEPSTLKTQPEAKAIEECRNLLSDAVRGSLRSTYCGQVWSHLSGGMDSSSIVSMAQWLAGLGEIPYGLGGTVTWADSHGTGADEREYANSVLNQWQVPNELVVDAPVWYDESHQVPWLDTPGMALVQYPRESRIAALVRQGGGRVLLTGTGGDILFSGNMFFFADWLFEGRSRQAVSEMGRRAAIGHVSFWELAYRNAILPLLPRWTQRRLVRDDGQMPTWLTKKVVRRHSLRERCFVPTVYAGRLGKKYLDARAAAVDSIAPTRAPGVVEDALDVRHPFLYRPLVEFALKLAPELCVRPHARKWVLREAMRGILPEMVRTRVGKGSVYGLLSWSISGKRQVLEPLLHDPILAQLGIIDPNKLRIAFSEAQHETANRQRLASAVTDVLAVEAWLQMRCGRWPRGATPG